MSEFCKYLPVISLLMLGLGEMGFSQTEQVQSSQEAPILPQRYVLVEPFTADTLEPGEIKLGLINVDYALFSDFMLGTDFLADLIGAPNFKVKYRFYQSEENRFALGLRGAYLDRATILWGSVKDHFDRLEAKIVSPSLIWTNRLSSRFNLHTLWGRGFGQIHAKLSEKGQRKLWESKHPGGDWTSKQESTQDDENSDPKANQEETENDQPATFKQRTLLFSSTMGMLADIFQMTGEFQRSDGNKILIASRIERTKVEQLRASSFRFTASQQWVWPHLQFRLGLGVQYIVITGVDLDGEVIDEDGFLPASDIDFYWRF